MRETGVRTSRSRSVFLGFGSPAVVVTQSLFDLHAFEEQQFEPLVSDLVRQLVGLRRLLSEMPHTAGGTFWDHTVVAVLSEFSRNNTSSGTGFNSGFGSDHVEEGAAPCRNQAIALMGGPIAGGRRIGATDDQMNPLDRVYGSRNLLSTFLDLLGIETSFWPERPIAELFT